MILLYGLVPYEGSLEFLIENVYSIEEGKSAVPFKDHKIRDLI